MFLADVNYLAVLVSAIASMFIGAMWYGPLFGKTWMKFVGKTEEQLKAEFNPAKTYGMALIGEFVALGVMANLFIYLNVSTLGAALHTAFWTWLGFTFATTFITGLFDGKKMAHLLIDQVYHLVVFIVGAIIIYVW